MERKRFVKQELNSKDYEKMEKGAALVRKLFPWIVPIIGLFIKEEDL
jgi:hypothetical protein